MLLAIVFGGVALGLWVNSASRQRRAVEALEQRRLIVVYDFQSDANGRFVPDAQSSVPAGVLQMLDIHFFHRAVGVHWPTCLIYDDDLEPLRSLPHLRFVHLRRTRVTDEGLAHLRDLHDLRRLDLGSTLITDQGIDDLAAFRKLELLSLKDANVTEEGFTRLQSALPNCEILWSQRSPPMSQEAIRFWATPQPPRDFVAESRRKLNETERTRLREAVEILQDKQHSLRKRRRAAVDLGKLRHVDGIAALQHVAEDGSDNVEVRPRCVRSLSLIADRRNVATLIGLLADDDGRVVYMAHYQIVKLARDGPNTRELLRFDLTVDERRELHGIWQAGGQEARESAELNWSAADLDWW